MISTAEQTTELSDTDFLATARAVAGRDGWPQSAIMSVADARAVVGDGCWFDVKAAKRVADFFVKFLRHSKGDFAGKPFEFLPWQRDDVMGPLFGWQRSDGTRRYRRAYIEVAKKNGKSSLCSGIALYMMLADGEPGAEVYSAAYTRDQASIIFRECASMVERSDSLKPYLTVNRSIKRINSRNDRSWIQAISKEHSSAEGINAHCLIFDELHTQKSRDLWDTLLYAGAARRQPLFVSITTAGWDRTSICWEQHQYAEGVIDGTIEDSSFFAYIAAADEDDEWTDPAVWRKANPSMGVTLNEEAFAESCIEAQNSPAKENAFRRYRLSQWTQQSDRWMSMDNWDACDSPVDVESLRGRECWVGGDLATTTDIASIVCVFPPQAEDEPFKVLPFFWVPEQLPRDANQAYPAWIKSGHLETTPGNVTDYEFIRARIVELADALGFVVRMITFDPWNATHLVTQLEGQDGFNVKMFRQGFASMTAPMKELDRLILSKRVAHGGHPVLRWMAGNERRED